MAAGLELFGFVLLQLPRLLGSEISGANRVSRRCAESISGRRVADKHLHPAISSAYIFTSNTNRHARIRTLIITHTHYVQFYIFALVHSPDTFSLFPKGDDCLFSLGARCQRSKDKKGTTASAFLE